MEQTTRERQVAILFADVSGFTHLQGSELTAFVDNFLTPFAEKIGDRVLVSNTWGDAIFLIFHTAREAADCALSLRDFIRYTGWNERGIHKEMSIRIALHNASAIFITDPITKRQNAYGPHINMAARLEPVTAPNEVFMTEGFKVALSSLQTTNAYDWDDVGRLALAKDWGTSAVYRLRRPDEQSLSRERLTKPRPDPMPNANALLASDPDAARETERLMNYLDEYLFSTTVIRQNWFIHAKYDVTQLESEGIITEYLEWSYELTNIGKEELEYPLSLMADPDLEGEGGLISFHLIEENGTPVSLPWEPMQTRVSGEVFTVRNQTIRLKPMQKYRPELWYRQRWPVNKKRPLIYNTFMPRETSFQNRLTIDSKELNSVGVAVCLEEVKSHTPTIGRYIFYLPQRMLRHQGVEVMLKFKPL